MKSVISIDSIKSRVITANTRSAWSAGVKLYALDLLKEIAEENDSRFLKLENGKVKMTYTISLLNQCYDMWVSFSRGGCSLIYNEDIAGRLCTPSEYKRAEKSDFFRANGREDWLDVQGRALFQAANMIKHAIREELAA